MAVKPTPTQEENDRTAMGEHVIEKEADGSAVEGAPPPSGETPPPVEETEPPHLEHHTRQTEAKKPARQAGYETRAVTPAKHPDLID